MSGRDHNSPPLTAEDVRKAYLEAKPTWNAPSVDDCVALASILEMYRGVHDRRAARRASKRSTAARRLIADTEEVRQAVGVLLDRLPALATWAHDKASPATQHAESLSNLLDAARMTAMLWPGLDGRIKRLDARTEWARSADCWMSVALSAWRRANSGRKIGKPLAAEQPATRLAINLLTLVGHTMPSAEAVAQHFTRDNSAFVLMESAQNSRQTFPS